MNELMIYKPTVLRRYSFPKFILGYLIGIVLATIAGYVIINNVLQQAVTELAIKADVALLSFLILFAGMLLQKLDMRAL